MKSKSISIISVVLLAWTTVAAEKSDDPAKKKKAQELHAALSQAAIYGPDHLGYLEFAKTILTQRYGLPPFPIPTKRRGREDFDAFSLLSGGLAIRESLQLDRTQTTDKIGDDVALSDLNGPGAKPHPFKEMLGDRVVKIPDLAAYAPVDFYYLHIEHPTQAADLVDHLSTTLGPLSRKFLPAAVDFDTNEKLIRQLAIRVVKSNRKYYDHIIEQMAVVGSDPFLMNGSDVTAIYKLKQPSVFKSTVEGYRDSYKKEFGAVATTVTIDGVTGELLSTPDRKVHSYFLILPDGTAIISNSQAAVKIVLATKKKTRPSLGDADEYRFMRGVYPYDPAKEDVFLYLSDPFIRRLNGPEVRLKEARRMREARRMARLELYAIFYYQMNGKRAESLKDLKEEFSDEEISAFDGLTITKDSFAAKSSTLGYLGSLLPNLEYAVDRVSTEEADTYKKFLTEYDQYWKTFFDPIGIRAKNDDRIRIETCILPLIENSAYQGMSQLTGGKPVVLRSSEGALPREIMSAGLKLNLPFLVGNAQGLQGLNKKLEKHGTTIEKAFGEELQIHTMDTLPLVDFDSSVLVREALQRRGNLNYSLWGILVWSLFHPIRIAVPMKEPAKADLVLSEILAWIRAEMIGSSNSGFRMSVYEQTQDGVKFNVALLSIEDILKFRFFFAMHEGVFHMTTTQDHLTQVLHGGLKKGFVARFLDYFKKKPEPVTSNAVGVYRPNRLALEKDQVRSGNLEAARDASFRNLSTYMLMRQWFGKEIDEPAMKSFGFRLQCPAGGMYDLNERGQPFSTVFGTPWNSAMDVDGPAARKLDEFFDIKELKVDMEFTQDGLKSRIETD